MSWDLNGQTANVEQALAGGSPQRAGWFRFYFADQRWEWSEQVQRMHGYEPGTVTPTTELVLEHKHPEDRRQVAATIDQILNTHEAFSTRHRIIDTTGQVHHVVVVGDELLQRRRRRDRDTRVLRRRDADGRSGTRRHRHGQAGRDRRTARQHRAGQGHVDAGLRYRRQARPSNCSNGCPKKRMSSSGRWPSESARTSAAPGRV